MPLVDYKNHKEGMPYELKFPFRSTNNNTKWPRTSSSPQTRTAGTGGTLIKAPSSDFSDQNSAAIPRSVSSDGRPLNPKRSQNKYNTVIKLVDALNSELSCFSIYYYTALNDIHISTQIFPRQWQLCSCLLHCDGSHSAQHKLPCQLLLHRHHELQPLEAEVYSWWVRFSN